MPLFHVQFDIVQRSKGQSAIKVAAYNAAARFKTGDGATYDFQRKRAEHQGHAVLLPAGAPVWAADAAELWRRAEAAEKRGDAQTARLVEFAIPRDVPPLRRMEFTQHVVAPWVVDGMAAQVDLHCVHAADGGEQPHAHVILSMRRLDDEKFAAKKERAWNERFQSNKGRDMRAAVAGRMNDWLEKHKIDVTVDHRRAVERGDDAPPERDVSKKTVEAWKKAPDSDAAAPFRAALDARGDRQRLRRARTAAQAWSAEASRLDAAIATIENKTPGVRPGDRRRRAPPKPWSPEWTPEPGAPHFAGCEIGRRSAMLALAGGGAIIDRGDYLTMKGRVTDEAMAAMASQAVRHGWQERGVEVTGDLAFRDRLSAALVARGVRVMNAEPSKVALRQAQRVLTAERSAAATPTASAAQAGSAQPIQKAAPPRPRAAEPEPAMGYAPALRPSWAKGPRKAEKRT